MENMDYYARRLSAVFDFIDISYTQQVKQVKDSMYVVFNRQREKFVVMDRDIKGTPYIFMVVQEETGAFRPFDERVLEDIRKSVQRGYDVRPIMRELDDMEEKRQVRVDKEAEDIEYGINSDAKWAGTDVVASTLWRDRTSHHLRERIREEMTSA